MFKRFAVIAIFVFCCCGLFAAPWFTQGSRRRPETMLVIGNYNSPFILAETYHALTNQPYLRIMQDGRIYLVMPKLIRGIATRELAGIIDSFGLKRIVIIGDERYVSAEFEKSLRKINTKATPIVRIYGENWIRVAEELDDLLNVGHLASNFRENVHQASIRTQPAQLRRLRKPAAPEAQPAEQEAPAVAETQVAAQEAAPAPAPAPAAPATEALPVDPVPAK